MMLFSKDEYRSIAKLQGGLSNNNTIDDDGMPSKKNRNNNKRGNKGRMMVATTGTTTTANNHNTTVGDAVAVASSSPLSLFSLDAAITEAKWEAACGSSTTHHRRASVVVASDVPHAANSSSSVVTTMIINDENAPPNEKRTIIDNRLHQHDGGFLPLGKPRRSFVGTKTMRIPGSVAVVATASPAETTAAAATTTATTPVDSSDDEVEDLNGDGNSLESLSPYSSMSSSTPRPASAGGGIVSNERTTPPGPPPPPPSSEMNYSTIMTTTSLYNLMGGQSDVICTPLTLELSRVLECSSFDNVSPSPAPAAKVIDEVVPGGDDDTPEDYSMPSVVDDDLPYPPSAEIVRIASAATTTASSSSEVATTDVVQTIYGAIKDAWASGKRIPVVSYLVDAAEAAAAELLHRIVASASGGGVGNSREMVLLDIDERVVKPRMKMLDEVIVSPIIWGVWRVVESIAMKTDEMVIGPISRGPLGALLFVDGNKKHAEVRS